ncbi:PAAR domain-containing protein [Oxalobacteraceae bacterium]|nr:PAAR domain-containing protein [Oxalobacteraceae bacterium]
MSKPIIRMGDRTSHGGTVISGDLTWTIYEKAVARAGDLTVCPKCKGTFPIAAGAGDLTAFGQAVARDGDKTACGATLIATQISASWDQQSDQGDASLKTAAEPLEAATKAVAQLAPTICLECLAAAAAAGSAIVVRS